jgi:hypothetical protein
MIRLVASLSIALAVSVSLPAANSFAFTLRQAPSLEGRTDAPPEVPAPFAGFARPFEPSAGGQPSTSRAVLYSLLLPGLGQYALGERSTAMAFFTAEGAVWTSFIIFEVQSYLRREQYKENAVVFAGVSTTNHSDDFYREIGDFDSSEDYELFIKNDGRAYTYPNSDYATIEDYYVQHRVSDFESWTWRSTRDREQYYSLRWGSRLASRRALYSLAAALGNRVFSMVLALRSSRHGGSASAVDADRRFRISLSTYPDAAGNVCTGLSLARDF